MTYEALVSVSTAREIQEVCAALPSLDGVKVEIVGQRIDVAPYLDPDNPNIDLRFRVPTYLAYPETVYPEPVCPECGR